MHLLSNLFANLTMKACVCLLTLFGFLLGCSPSQAQTEGSLQVLVLHGIWNERAWQRDFDEQFSTSLSAQLGRPAEISFHNLDLSPSANPQSVEFFRQAVNGIVDTVGIDVIVAVLPSAVDFVKTLDSYTILPMVLTLPAILPQNAVSAADNSWIVRATAGSAIRNTLNVATALHPNAATIELFSDSAIDAFSFKRMAEQVIEQEFADYELVTHYNKPLAQMISTLSLLSDDSIVLALPYLSEELEQSGNSAAALESLSAASAQPLYGFAEPSIGSGLAGGYFYTAKEFAAASAEAAVAAINNAPYDGTVSGAFSSYIFDYEEVQRHKLQLNRLDVPYTVVNQPRSLVQDYRNTVYLTGVIFLLFCVAFYQVLIALKKSESAKKQLQVSEQLAKESQLRYELLTKNTLDVIWTWDQDQRQTTYCSPSIFQLTGYTAAEFMSLGMRQVMTESSAEHALALVFSPSRSSGMFEIELIRKDGSKIWCELSAQPITEEGANKNEWVGITRDISKRKREESERLALEGQLRQAQKFESLGTLAGGIAHDFNNMLGVMIGLNELLKLKIGDNPATVSIVDKLMAITDRAKGLVGQILAFSRQSNLHKVQFNLADLASDSLRLIQSGMPKSVKLEQNLGAEPITVLADSNQVSQVFIIILTNAFEALEAEQGEIDFSIHEVEITSEQECLHGKLEPGLYAKIKVSDNGLGVSEDRIDKIFDPFYTSKDLGSGMGLSIARGIVMAHSGGIDFRSKPFRGSTITVYLPAQAANGLSIPQSESVPEAKRSTILLVDDQTDLLETVGMMLGVLGHDCIVCSDPRKAMEIIADTQQQFDLVITDYSMPEVTGLDIANSCADKRPSIPVILATGYNDSTAFLGAQDTRDWHILSKPFGFNELKLMLNSVL